MSESMSSVGRIEGAEAAYRSGMRLLSSILALSSVATLLVACNDPPPAAVAPEAAARPAQTASPSPTAPATSSAPVAALRITITAHGDTTQAAPALPPGAKTRPHVLGYRIEPASAGTGYDVIEEATGQPERRGKLSDESMRALAAKASDYAKKGCKMAPSPHNDPHIHIEGGASVDARGGIAQCEASFSASACAECKDGFRELHAAILGVAKTALP